MAEEKQAATGGGSGLPENVAGALAYVLGPVTGVLFLVLEKKSKFVRFHAMQSLITFGGLFVIGSTITFWTIQPIEIMNIFTYGGSEMMSYPMHIYKRWMRQFFTYMIPAIFLNYLPALYFLDKPNPIGTPEFTLFLSPVAGFGILFIALQFWRYGVRNYQSTGT